MAAYENLPMRVVWLRKVGYPETAPFKYTYKSLAPTVALARAHARLKAERPNENPYNWKEDRDG